MDKSDICNACREAAMHDGVICDCERCNVDITNIPDITAMSINVIGTSADYLEDCRKAIASALRIPRDYLNPYDLEVINNDKC